MAARDDDDDNPRPKKKKDDAISDKPSPGVKRRRADDDDNDDDENGGGGPSVEKKKSNTLWYVLGGVGVFALLACCCLPAGVGGFWWYSTNATAEARLKKVESEAGMEVTSEEITLAFQENEAAANAKYKDKVLIVKGNVMAIPNPESVRLRPGVPPGKITIGGTHCTFADKNKGQVATIRQGENVRIKGYCTGTAILDPVVLVQCKKMD